MASSPTASSADRLKQAVIPLTVLLISGCLIAFGMHGFPPPGGDAVAFIPPAINLALGKGLVNPIYDLTSHIDLTGGNRFLYYVPLLQLYLAALMPVPTPEGAFRIIALTNGLTLALSALCFDRVSRLHHRKPDKQKFEGFSPDSFSILLIITALFGLSTRFIRHYGGRPEVLGSLFLMLAVTAVFYLSGSPLVICLGILLGLMGATHPVGAVLFALLIGMFYSLRQTPKQALLSFLGSGFLSAVTFITVLWLSPYGILEILKGTYEHGLFEVKNQQFYDSLIDYYITNPNATFYGVLILVALGIGGYLFIKHKAKIGSPKLFLAFAALFLFVAWSSSIRRSFSSYNLLMFSPLFFGLVIYAGCHLLDSLKPRLRSITRIACLLLLAATSIGFVHTLFTFPFSLKDGTTLTEARARFSELLATQPGKIGVSRSLWTLSENYDRMFIWEGPQVKLGADTEKNRRSVLLLQQTGVMIDGKAPLAAPKILTGDGEGHVLSDSDFYPKPPKLLGKKIMSSTPGYQFAVYLPSD